MFYIHATIIIVKIMAQVIAVVWSSQIYTGLLSPLDYMEYMSNACWTVATSTLYVFMPI